MNRAVAALLALPLLAGGPAWAKRTPAPQVAPVVYRGVRYVAPNRAGDAGLVQAWDVRTGRMLWQAVAYRVRIKPRMEQDVQWRFITGLRVQGESLVVTNESGGRFVLDRRTGRVERARSGS